MNALPAWVALISFMALVLTVALRVLVLRRRGIQPVKVGQRDKSDFLIPPFALAYAFLVYRAARAMMNGADMWHAWLPWAGALLCLAAVFLFLWGMASFRSSFRIGIDDDQPGPLITNGAFAISRNPLYVAFLLLFLGILLVFGRWTFALFLAGAAWLIHRQILREEEVLRPLYGQAYQAYSQRVRRYL